MTWKFSVPVPLFYIPSHKTAFFIRNFSIIFSYEFVAIIESMNNKNPIKEDVMKKKSVMK